MSIPVAANIRIASASDRNNNEMKSKELEKDWCSEAPLETLKARARLLSLIRRFFESVQVLEVETPILARCTVTDLHIESFGVRPFDYNINIEINNDLTPSTWKNKEI